MSEKEKEMSSKEMKDVKGGAGRLETSITAGKTVSGVNDPIAGSTTTAPRPTEPVLKR